MSLRAQAHDILLTLRAQTHDILLNHDFYTSVHNMNLWPYMKIMLHSEKDRKSVV